MKIFILYLLCMPWVHGYEIKDFLPEAPLIFDVGAHRGKKTEEYLALGAREVICVEPQQECIDFLIDQFSECPQVVVLPMALAAREMAIPFYICPEGTALSTASQEWQSGRFSVYSWNPPIEVSATTLDALISEYGVPDFCKIDVEGYECEVLQGLSAPIPCLSFEFAQEFLGNNTKQCLEHLAKLGYRYFNVTYGESSEFALGWFVPAKMLLRILAHDPDPLLWGDIYAFYEKPKMGQKTITVQ